MPEFKALKNTWRSTFPDPLPQRVRDLDGLDRIRDGSIYDKLMYPFSQEYEDTGAKDYISIEDRRPSARYRMAKVVVDETAALTFGEGHSPYIKVYNPFESIADDDDQSSDDTKTKKLTRIVEFLRYIVRMDAVMFECIQKGSSGSVCAIVKITSAGKPWVRVVRGADLHPTFSHDDPDELIELREIYQTTLKDLIDFGYSFAELGYSNTDDPPMNKEYWVNHVLTPTEEYWMKPLKREDFDKVGKKKDSNTQVRWDWERDENKVWPHKWKCVPAIWMRNLHEREEIDGPSTYEAIVENCIELDYLISQIGRGFKYSMDPLLAVKQGTLSTRLPVLGGETENDIPNVDRTPARVVNVPEGGDAKMLEIQGQGLTAAKDWTKLLREWSMEVVGGMKSDQEHAGGPQSGRALELLHQALVWLVGRMRLDYGDGGMIPLIKLFLYGIKEGFVELWGVKPEDVPDEDYPLRNVWPNWWQPRGADLYQTAQALLLGAGGSSREGKQMLPMQFIFEAFAAALGHPDPSAIAEKAQKEFDQYRAEQLEILKPKPAQGAGGNPTGGAGS